jgi:hypothetical protein
MDERSRCKRKTITMMKTWLETLAEAKMLNVNVVERDEKVRILLEGGSSPIDCIKILKFDHGLKFGDGKVIVDSYLDPEHLKRLNELRDLAGQAFVSEPDDR